MPTYAIADDATLRRVVSYLPTTEGVQVAQAENGSWSLLAPDEMASAVSAGLAATQDYVPVPQEVTMAQARAALQLSGLLDTISTALAADMSAQGRVNWQFWEYANMIRRNAPLVTALSGQFGLTSDQIDNLFRQAATL